MAGETARDLPTVNQQVDDNAKSDSGTEMSYPNFMPKPCTHRMCAQDHLFHTHRSKVFTDSQMSQIKYIYYINNVSKD
jgi:hypothetical protein